ATGTRPGTTGGVGGSEFDDGNSGDISVTVTGGDLNVLAGRDFATFAQIGHGGYSTRDSHSGNLTIDISGGISLVASSDETNLLGGDFNPGANNDAYAQIGHGGLDSDGNHSGNIAITAGTHSDAALGGHGFYGRAGDWDDNYVQVGHGGAFSRGYGTQAAGLIGNTGDISLTTTGHITFLAGSYSNLAEFTNEDGRNSASIGHGGYDADISRDGSNNVRNQFQSAAAQATNGIAADPTLLAGHNGDITVVASNGAIKFLAGEVDTTVRTNPLEVSAGRGRGNYHYAQAGHGGANSHGNHFGDITMRAGIAADGTVAAGGDGDIILASGGASDNEWADNGNYAQVGHGGRSDQGSIGVRDLTGALQDTFTIMAGRDIHLDSSNASPTGYTMIGNGGWGARGEHAADINLYAERDVKLAGGNRFTGAPALGSGSKVSYGFGGHTSGWNNTINQDFAANLNGGANFNTQYTRVVAGSLRLSIRLDDGTIIGTLSDSDGDGTLTADADITADFQDGLGERTITAGTVVGNVTNYGGEGNATITFLEDVNPGVSVGSGPNTEAGDAGTVNIWVNLETGDHDQTWSMIGNGGGESDNANNAIDLGHRGNITVAARTGDISLEGGTDDISNAQIGHGGHGTKGHNVGDIHVRAGGDVSLIAGLDRAQNHTQIGHGGWDADGNHDGVIKVSAGTGDLYTNLGAGLFNDLADFDGDTVLDGIQFASSGPGNILLKGGASENNAQIGHGGRSAFDGNTTINGVIGVSATGDIDLLSGNASRAYAQIGHGGWHENQAADITGDISVITTGGDITLKAAGWNTYSVIGHGGDDNNESTRLGGTREGAINVVGDKITLDRNGDRLAWIGHVFDMANNVNDPFSNTNVLANAADNLGGGYSVIARSGMALANNGNTVGNNQFTINDYIRDLLITPNLSAGDVTISGGNIAVNSLLDSTTVWADPLAVNSGLNLIAGGDIDVNWSIQAPGTGDVNLIAGANIATGAIVDGTDLVGPVNHLYFPPTAVMNILAVKPDGDQFGNTNLDVAGNPMTLTTGGLFSSDNGEVQIGNAGRATAVGSLSGMTNVLG
ncbi:MAG: hypothetical protein L7T84_15230, partial [Akkermansiaceae bacterium]|nr:hypothetical protein [Akkermansiaceae bacterium]